LGAETASGLVRTMKCPSCGGYIRTDNGAARCACGWRRKPDRDATFESLMEILRELKAELERMERAIKSL